MKPKHQAIVAGLALSLTLGVAAPIPMFAQTDTVQQQDIAGNANADPITDVDAKQPAPSDYDPGDEYSEAVDSSSLMTLSFNSIMATSSSSLQPMALSSELKYFAQNESGSNYNLGFSYGDGYHAMGFYQFDRRYALVDFMQECYNYNPQKYGMFKAVIDRGSELKRDTDDVIYDKKTHKLTELGQLAEDAWHAAYAADPQEFSALQDAYGYQEYYLPVERIVRKYGLDLSGRADCLKGLCWGMNNLFGSGGCQKFFKMANLSNDMSDREFVTALSNSVVNNVATKYSSQPQYHEGWKNRYRNELKDCLVYIAEDEAAAATPVQPEPTPAPSPTPDSNDDSSDDANDDRMDAPSTDADGNGSAGGTTNDGSTSNGSDSNGSAAGDSPSSSAGNTDSDASGSTGADTSNSSTGSNNGSGSDATPDSDASKDDSNKAPDAPVASPDKKPSFSEQLGSTLGSSLMAGVNNGSAQNKDNSDQVSTEKTEASKGDSKDKASEKTEFDKGSSSEEKGDKPEQKKDEGKKPEPEEKDKSKDKTEDGKQQGEDSGKSGADNQVQEQNDSKTVTTTTTTTTATKSSGGNMPKTGDLIVMASLASASLATLGATSIVSGKHKLDQQKKASGEDGSEE